MPLTIADMIESRADALARMAALLTPCGALMLGAGVEVPLARHSIGTTSVYRT